MKRSLFIAGLAALISAGANAQYKPAADERTLEVNFAPLGGTPISIGGIKYRMFSSETSAFRLGLFIGHGSTSEVTQDENSQAEAIELKKKNGTTTINLQPGIEKHFAGTERLSPYVGAVLNIGYGMTSTRTEHQVENKQVGTETEKGGSLDLGLNALAGFDYYVANKLYIGTEIGFGLGLTKDLTKKVKYDNIRDADGNPRKDEETKVGNKSRFNVGPNVVGQLRLGWVF